MIVSITIVRYRKTFIPFALLAMAVHRLPLMLEKNCSFWKLLGSGKNGTFSLNPDWQQWGLLSAWQSMNDLDNFHKTSFITKWWKAFCKEQWTIVCEPVSGHGKWDGKEPFLYNPSKDYSGPIVVLTRAVIRFNRLKNFWAHVKQVSEIMKAAPGYIMSLGIGEAPVYKQATLSVWESLEKMKDFSYQSKEHAEVIRKTRTENWYSEELFARFKLLKSEGTINGINPLKFKNKKDENCCGTTQAGL